MPDVTMPRLSDSMEEGTIIAWLVADGENVTVGQELAEIETDKATMTYEAEVDGVLEHVVAVGTTVALGAIIARIVGPGEERSTQPVSVAAAVELAAPSVLAPAAPAQRPTGSRVSASPLARRVAAELDIDLEALSGTGPRGRIVRADVEQAGVPVEPAPPAPVTAPVVPPAEAGNGHAPEHAETAKGRATVLELTRAQKVIARRMAESRATVPDFATSMDVDMEAAWALREELKVGAGEGVAVPSVNDLVVMACARTLAEHPNVNASYRDGRVERFERVNVGVAIATPDSLVVATVSDADRRSLGDIAYTSRALAGKVRDGSITPPELAGGTFTVSNLGMLGVDRFTAVVNTPQAAILAVGAVTERAVVRDGEIVARRTMTITLTADHRLLYGADAARFIARVRELLQAPLWLLAGG
jgi:pyruvate dehydrogenase E2 component (dihydrolipoamide acetyltransferase)